MGLFGGSLTAESYDRQYTDKYLLQRVLAYFRRYQRRVILVVIATLAVSAASSSGPIWVSLGIDSLNDGKNTISLLIGAYLVSVLIQYVAYRIRRRLVGRLVGDVISQMREDAFAGAIYRDLAFYDETKSGKVVSRITSDTQEFSQIILITTDIIAQLFEVVVIFFVLVSREWRLTLMLMVMVPVIISIALGFRRLSRIVTRQGARAMAAVNDNIQESVTGISVAKNFRREALIYDEFDAINKQSYKINLKRGLTFAFIFPTLNAVAGLAIGSVLYVGATAVVGGVIEVGSWYLFLQGIDRFMFPFINLASYWGQVQQGLSAVERIFALIDSDNTVCQIDDKPVSELKGKIEFQHVDFNYKPQAGERGSLLKDFSLTIQPGESVAFVGHTGAGKSTIARLIARFYEFQGGNIVIDGQDIRSFDMKSYRGHLGIVPQAPFLFSGTIMQNIRYARPEATDAEIEEVARSIGDGEWLETMPKGLQSDVGERGARLSMGQRQLVSLLRVLVQKPAIFILDEATASIDPFTEMQIQEALDMILSFSTSILIAHRLSTVRSADRIIVLKNGSIIEQGNHESLLSQNGHYAELYNTYFRHQSLSYVESSRAMFGQEADMTMRGIKSEAID
jgi:ATP-binding cassette, subfamily B, bacterial